MVVGVLRVELHVPSAQSLKDKRAVVKSVKDQLRGRFNVAVAEVEANEKWQRASIGIVTVGADQTHAQGPLKQVTEWLREMRVADLIRIEEDYVSSS